MPTKLLTKRQLAGLLGLHPGSVMRKAATESRFPQPVFLGPDMIGPNGKPCKANVRFRADEIEAYQQSLREDVPNAAA